MTNPKNIPSANIDEEEIEALTGGDAQIPLRPKDWTLLQKSFKDSKENPPRKPRSGKYKKGKGKPNKKGMGSKKKNKNRSKISTPFQKFLKREHSKVYHPARNTMMANGVSKPIAGERASALARSEAHRLRVLYQNGALKFP